MRSHIQILAGEHPDWGGDIQIGGGRPNNGGSEVSPQSGVQFGSGRWAGWCFLTLLFLGPLPPTFPQGAGQDLGRGVENVSGGGAVASGRARCPGGSGVSGGAQASGGAGPRREEASGNRRGGLSPTLLGHRRTPDTRLPFRRPGWGCGAGAELPRARCTSGGRSPGTRGLGSRG